MQQRDETGVRILRAGLAQHLANHVYDPGALGVDHALKTVRRFGGDEPAAEGKRAEIRGRKIHARRFLGELIAVVFEPEAQLVIGAFLAVRKEQGEIVGERLINPLIAIARPADYVSPPLVSDFVEGHQLAEVLLRAGGKPRAQLGLRGQEGIGRKIEQAGPALTERSRNLGNAQLRKRKRSAIAPVKLNGRIYLFPKLLERVRRTRLDGRQFHAVPARGKAEGRGNRRRQIGAKRAQPVQQSLLELLIRIHIHGIAFGGEGSEHVLAQIEARDANGLFGAPVPDAELSLFVLVHSRAGRGQTKAAGPAQGEVVRSEIRGAAEPRVPTVAVADEQNAIAGIANDPAVVADAQRELRAGCGSVWKNDVELIHSARAALLRGKLLVVEGDKGRAILGGHGVNVQIARELERDEPLTGNLRPNAQRSGAFDGIIRANRSVDCVASRDKRHRWRRDARKPIRCPNVVERAAILFPDLADDDGLFPNLIDEDVERTGGGTIQPGVEVRARMRRERFGKQTNGVNGIQMGDEGSPAFEQIIVRFGSERSIPELSEKNLRRVVGEAQVGRGKVLVEDGSAEKQGKLLFLHDVARCGENVPAAGKDGAGHSAVERYVEG